MSERVLWTILNLQKLTKTCFKFISFIYYILHYVILYHILYYTGGRILSVWTLPLKVGWSRAKSKSIMVLLDHVFLSLKNIFCSFYQILLDIVQWYRQSISNSSCRQYRHTQTTRNKESGGIRIFQFYT